MVDKNERGYIRSSLPSKRSAAYKGQKTMDTDAPIERKCRVCCKFPSTHCITWLQEKIPQKGAQRMSVASGAITPSQQI